MIYFPVDMNESTRKIFQFYNYPLYLLCFLEKSHIYNLVWKLNKREPDMTRSIVIKLKEYALMTSREIIHKISKQILKIWPQIKPMNQQLPWMVSPVLQKHEFSIQLSS